MYNVLLDKNNFYTGSYTCVEDSKIENGTDVETLPPSKNSLCYRLVETKEITDEGEVIIIQSWEYSQEKYDELEAKRIEMEAEKEVEIKYRASISNEALASRIKELEINAITMDFVSEVILEGVNEV